MNLQKFLSDVSAIYKTGAATEHSYRAALQNLLSSIGNDIIALNEPKRVKCGAPDFIVSQGDVVIGHVEAKDIDVGIRGLKGSNKNQHVPQAPADLFHRSRARRAAIRISGSRGHAPVS